MSIPLATSLAGEVLPASDQAADNFAAANREYACVLASGAAIVEHAIRCGEALLRAESEYIEATASQQMPPWLKYLDTNFDGGHNSAHTYMRLARYQDIVREHGFTSLNSARLHLSEVGAKNHTGQKPPPDWLLEEMRRLRREGWTIRAVAEHIGKSRSYVQHWTAEPEAHEAQKARNLAHWHKKQAAAKALQERERQRAIKRAVRKAGAATAEAWAMAERFQDVIAQAHDETQDSEARAALARAGEHYRKMRDEIVRALGVV